MKLRITLSLLFLIITCHHSNADDVLNKIKQLGFHLVHETPTEFTLNNLADQPKRLSDWKGKWIILSFWATWCGPCQIEMPQLQKLHDQLNQRGLSIVGISVDQKDLGNIKKFISKNKITFPILWDKNGTASNQYQAKSIPSLYLISPDFKLIGIMRGAKNWDNPQDLTTLAQIIDQPNIPDKAFDNLKIQTKEDNELLIAPELHVHIDEENLVVGQKISLKVSIHWKGPFEKFLIKVPRIEMDDSIRRDNVQVSSVAEEENAKLTYHYPLIFTKQGPFKIGPITMSFQPRLGGNEQFSRHEGLTLEIKQEKINPIFFLILGVAIFTLAIISFYVLKNKKRKISDKNTPFPEERKNKYEQLKKLKITNKQTQYQKMMLELYKETALLTDNENKKLDEIIQDITYGGKILSNQEIQHFEKKVEAIIYPSNDN